MTQPTPKEVNYSKYCPTCMHMTLKDYLDPCNTCLEQFWNEGTDKPVKYEEKNK